MKKVRLKKVAMIMVMGLLIAGPLAPSVPHAVAAAPRSMAATLNRVPRSTWGVIFPVDESPVGSLAFRSVRGKP